jgi:DNA-binding CsgD family transcriptional regulator/tetratricopeptide (TPR) repeat protein
MSGRPQKETVASLRAAASDARERGANAIAARHLERALELTSAAAARGDLLLDLARAEAATGAGRFKHAAQSAGEARRSFEVAGDVRRAGQATIVAARYHWYARETVMAEELARRAIATLEPLGETEELAEAHAELARQLALAHQGEEATRWGESAVTMARRVGAKPKILVDALTTAGVQLALQGRLEGVALLEESAALALRSQLPVEAARANHNWAITLFLTGCSEKEFRSAFELSLATARRLGHESQFAYVNLLLLLYDGDWDDLVSLAKGIPQESPLYTRARMTLEYVQVAREGPNAGTLDVVAHVATLGRGQAEGLGDIAFGVQVLYLAGQERAGLELAETLAKTLVNRYPMPQLDDAAMISIDAARRIGDRRLELTWIERCLTAGRSREPVTATARRLFGQAERAFAGGAVDQAIESYRECIRLHDDVHPLPRELVRRRLIEALLARGHSADRTATAAYVGEMRGMWQRPRAAHRLAWLSRWGEAHSLAVPDAISVRPEAAPRSARVSAREREVAALIADGLGNRAIAERLGLSERTIEAHVEHILDKLGFSSRSKVATWVTQDRNRTGTN